MTAQLIIVFSFGLPAFVMVKALQPSFFARQDTRAPLIDGAIGVGVNIALSLALFASLWCSGHCLCHCHGRLGNPDLNAVAHGAARYLSFVMVAAASLGSASLWRPALMGWALYQAMGLIAAGYFVRQCYRVWRLGLPGLLRPGHWFTGWRWSLWAGCAAAMSASCEAASDAP